MKKLLLSFLAVVSVWTVSAQQSDYVPLVREGVEWGYISQRYEAYGETSYMRQQFKGTTEIDGKTYHNLYVYSYYYLNDFMPKTLVAYMREENKKVYARLAYPESFAADRFPWIADNNEEVLLFDFGLNVGDKFLLPNGLEAVCSETGNIETANGTRRYIKFGDFFQYGFYLIEGIGPCIDTDYDMHSSSIAMPYTEAIAANPNPRIYDTLLYERVVNSGDKEGLQGAINFKSPYFATHGVHDPSVWNWPAAEQGAVQSIAAEALPDSAAKIEVADGSVSVKAVKGSLKFVELYSVDGKLITTFAVTAGDQFVFSSALLPAGATIVKASTSEGSASLLVAK